MDPLVDVSHALLETTWLQVRALQSHLERDRDHITADELAELLETLAGMRAALERARAALADAMAAAT